MYHLKGYVGKLLRFTSKGPQRPSELNTATNTKQARKTVAVDQNSDSLVN